MNHVYKSKLPQTRSNLVFPTLSDMSSETYFDNYFFQIITDVIENIYCPNQKGIEPVSLFFLIENDFPVVDACQSYFGVIESLR